MQRRSLLACAVLIASTFVSTDAAVASTDPSTGTAAPNPNAPKRGVVAGAQNFTPNARNAKAVQRFRELNRSRVKRDDVHQFWGIEPAAGTHDGLMATQSVDPSYQVSSEEDFTYTPTLKAAGSCMEVTTAYSQVMGNEVWAWDWCGSTGPAKQLQMDDSFMETYTSTVNGHQAYSVQLVQTDAATNEWGAYLYNQKTKAWELFYSQSGSDQSQLNYGWDLFEIYATTDPSTGTAYYCSEAKNVVFESSSIQLRQKGEWRPAGPSDSPWQPSAEPNPNDYLCPTLKFERAGQNDHWIVRQ